MICFTLCSIGLYAYCVAMSSVSRAPTQYYSLLTSAGRRCACMAPEAGTDLTTDTRPNAQFTPPARQDKTVLSDSVCRIRRCELSRPDKCVLRRSASGGRITPPDTLRHRPLRPDTERTCLAVDPTELTPPHQTRQNRPVCFVSGVAV